MAKSNHPATESRLMFGRRLRQERNARGLTLEDLAELSGITWSYIAQVETGKRNVAIDNLHRLAEGVGVPLRLLLTELEG